MFHFGIYHSTRHHKGQNTGNVKHEVALALAEKEYGKLWIIQDKLYESDFDKALKELPELNKKILK